MNTDNLTKIQNIKRIKQIKIPFLKEVKNGKPVFVIKTITVPDEPLKNKYKNIC